MNSNDNNWGLGRHIKFRRVIPPSTTTTVNTTTDTTTTNNNNDYNDYNKKIMQISLETYSQLQEFSRKYHNMPTSYDDLILELIYFWNSNQS